MSECCGLCVCVRQKRLCNLKGSCPGNTQPCRARVSHVWFPNTHTHPAQTPTECPQAAAHDLQCHRVSAIIATTERERERERERNDQCHRVARVSLLEIIFLSTYSCKKCRHGRPLLPANSSMCIQPARHLSTASVSGVCEGVC